MWLEHTPSIRLVFIPVFFHDSTDCNSLKQKKKKEIQFYTLRQHSAGGYGLLSLDISLLLLDNMVKVCVQT